MSSKTIYHYVYRITNTVEFKHYYGSRTSRVHPSKDLGKKYFSTSHDKDFKRDQKENPHHYKYKVIGVFDTREEAVEMEIKLHERFDVGVNESFYNKAKQTSAKFDTTGMISVRDTETGETLNCSPDHPLYLSGHYVSVARDMITVKDIKTGECLKCRKDDVNYLSGRYVSVLKGRVSVRDTETGETLSCSVDDPLYVSGRYVHINKGRVQSQETRKKKSEYAKGRKHTEESKRKISESNKKPRPKVKCKYCDMVTIKTNITKYHNENCKHKPKEN